MEKAGMRDRKKFKKSVGTDLYIHYEYRIW